MLNNNILQIVSFARGRLRNDEFYQFISEVIRLTNLFGADKLKIEELFGELVSAFNLADAAIRYVRGCALTKDVQDLDRRRNNALTALNRKFRNAEKDFDPEVKKAAQNLKVVFNAYKNLTRLPMNEKTSAITNFVQELQGRYKAHVRTAMMERWVEDLDRTNNEMILTKGDRRTLAIEKKPEMPFAAARKLLDQIFSAITRRINSLVDVEGDENYRAYILEINKLITVYRNTLAKRSK